MKRFFLLSIVWLSLVPALQAIEPPSNFNYEHLRSLPILDDGRYKPLDSYAGKMMDLITGRWKFHGHEPSAMLAFILADPAWTQIEMIRIDYHPLKQEIGLDLSRHYYSYEELQANAPLSGWMSRVQQKSMSGLAFTKIESAVAKIMNQMNDLLELESGSALTIVPPPGENDDDGWLAINESWGYPEETETKIKAAYESMLEAVRTENAEDFETHSATLKHLLTNLNPKLSIPFENIDMEVFYNQFRPFMKAWICCLLAFLIFLLSFHITRPVVYWTAFAFMLAGFTLSAYGLLLRALIAGWVPVTNMYESMVFVGWGILGFALVFEGLYRRRWFAAVGSALGVGMLILADFLPFDSNIEPLVPVLRSNYWLILHVLTITLSYSAFALAMGLAHINLALYFFGRQWKDLLNDMSLFVYWILQVGTVFLAAGTILGGVWAAESWGRFWGWDPKETWALICFLGYMAILHARRSGWLRDFGTAVCSIFGFWLVLMTWYGVNFVLGTGLHSYGFGSGGEPFVIAYLIGETLFVIAVFIKYNSMNQIASEESGAG